MRISRAEANKTGNNISDGEIAATLESSLRQFLPRCRSNSAGTLNDALCYALFPGGKRLRPLLTIHAARIFELHGERLPDERWHDERVLRAACAVEFVHASSLIIDDLPCMDDASLRRRNPTLHLVYGEDVALLAAIALLNQAYALFGGTPELIREATECIGVGGMIGGQVTDLCPCAGTEPLAERDRKTSALMRLALTAGALSMGMSRDDVAPLATAGQRLGQAYQICDDLMDNLRADESGKTASQDSRHERPSHNARPEPDALYAQMADLVEEARDSLLRAFGTSDGVMGLLCLIDKSFAAQSRVVQQSY